MRLPHGCLFMPFDFYISFYSCLILPLIYPILSMSDCSVFQSSGRYTKVVGREYQYKSLGGNNMRIKSQTIMFFIFTILLGGCATNKEFMATGGSRSDGTVKLSYEYGEFQKPVVDLNQGIKLARSKCGVWGYTGAEPFGSSERTCVAGNGYGCTMWRVTVEYQCIGSPSK